MCNENYKLKYMKGMSIVLLGNKKQTKKQTDRCLNVVKE